MEEEGHKTVLAAGLHCSERDTLIKELYDHAAAH